MKDNFKLLLCGLAGALLAWAFWHYLDSDAVGVLMALTLALAVCDNFRLRRRLRQSRRSG